MCNSYIQQNRWTHFHTRQIKNTKEYENIEPGYGVVWLPYCEFKFILKGNISLSMNYYNNYHMRLIINFCNCHHKYQLFKIWTGFLSFFSESNAGLVPELCCASLYGVECCDRVYNWVSALLWMLTGAYNKESLHRITLRPCWLTRIFWSMCSWCDVDVNLQAQVQHVNSTRKIDKT